MASSTSSTAGEQTITPPQSGHLAMTDAPSAAQDQSAASQPVLHPPADAATTTCRFWLSGHCYRDSACWFRHELGEGERRVTLAELHGETSTSQDPPLGLDAPAATSTSGSAQPSEIVASALAPLPEPPCCDICYEIPATYGLMENCSHVFCLTCIRQWRAPGGDTRADLQESGATKACPACRKRSFFIIPCSTHHGEGETKNQIIRRYKDVLSRKPCKHFEQTKNSSRGPACPFGDECHYKHQLTEGDARYTFGRGYQPFRETESRRRIHRSLRRLPDQPALRMQLDRLTRIMLSTRNRAMWEDPVQRVLEEATAAGLSTSRDRWVQDYRRAQDEGEPVPVSQREAELQQQWGNAWDQLDAAEEASQAAAATETNARGANSSSSSNSTTAATPSNSDQPEASVPTRSSASPEESRSSTRSQRRRAQRYHMRELRRNAESVLAIATNIENGSNGAAASHESHSTTTNNNGIGGNRSATSSSDAPRSTPASRRAAFERHLATMGDNPFAPDFPAEMYDEEGHLIDDDIWSIEDEDELEDLEDVGYALYGTGGHRGPRFFDEDGLEIETFGMVDWSDEEDGVWYQV